MITIVAVGKKHEPWVKDGIERYQKRLKVPYNVTWELLPHSTRSGFEARQEESGRILSRTKDDSYVVLLDERGVLLDSFGLSTLLTPLLNDSRHVTLIIGGAYGVDERIQQRANTVWSLSPLVFPHQLVRLLVTEQIYRAQDIARGGQYHHE